MASNTLIEVKFDDGEVFRAWESLTLRDTFTDPCSDYRMRAVPPRDQLDHYRKHLRKGDAVRVFINGRPQGRMVIQTVTTTVDRGGVAFDVEMQSLLCTPYEASAPPGYAFSSDGDVSISKVIRDLMLPYGFDKILINSHDDTAKRLGGPRVRIGKKSIKVEDLKHKDCQVQDSETVYGVCDRIITRMGMCLRVDTDGQLLVSSPNYDQDAAYTLVQSFKNGGKGNHMLEGIRLSDTNRNQFSECVVRGERPDGGGQKAAAQPAASVVVNPNPYTPEQTAFSEALLSKLDDIKKDLPKPYTITVKSDRPAYHGVPGVAPYKPKHFKDKKTRDAARAASLAKFILGMRAKDAYVLECEVDGWVSVEGHVWTVDTIANVQCDAFGISAPMWILERTLNCSRDRGMMTSLKLIPPGNLILGDTPE